MSVHEAERLHIFSLLFIFSREGLIQAFSFLQPHHLKESEEIEMILNGSRTNYIIYN